MTPNPESVALHVFSIPDTIGGILRLYVMLSDYVCISSYIPYYYSRFVHV